MKQKKQNGDLFSEPEQNGNHLDIQELTLSEEAAFLIQLIFEEFEELLNDYPHHAAYCFASIIHLADTDEDLSHFTRRLGMWLWIEVLSFQTEEPLSLPKLADHFETDVKTVQNGIDELIKTGQFEMEWKHRNKIKLVPRMLKETVLRFAEQVVSGIEAGKQAEGTTP
ncbi:hypothetical protein F4Z99_02455 [Candidatus Poribacteria bacterium]|nr:hypothetical protein [Candidatus Poribacteria bacterium]MYB00998.1 hypothetical protein [Candidatus Poribacteria bacterium]